MTNSSNRGAWLMKPPEESPSALRLFCFAPAGSGAAIYRLWPKALAPDIAVYRIQPPGRETRFREPLITHIDDYVDALVPELLPDTDRPFAFFGHSMGALIAYRVACALRSKYSRVPTHLLASAFRSPQAPPMKKIYTLPHDEFVRELRDTYDGVPDELMNEPEILELLLPIVRADLQVIDTHRYQPQAAFDCPISAFGGIADRWVDESQLREWSEQTAEEFSLTLFPGNHYYLNTAQNELLEKIRAILLA